MIYFITAIGLTPVGSSTVQYSAVQYNTVQYSTVQYNTVQYSAVQYSTVQYSAVQYSAVHIYTQTIHRTTRNKQYTKQHKFWEECGPCPVFASYTLAFALHLRKKHGKPSVRVAEECQLAR